jgi:hypothetical protein
VSSIDARMQAFRESKGHALTKQPPIQQGVDVDPDKDMDEFSMQGDPDIEPESDPAAKKDLIRKAVTGRPAFQGGTRTDATQQADTGEVDTGGFDTGMIDTGYLDDEPPKIQGRQEEGFDTGMMDTGEPESLSVNAQGVQITDAVLEDFDRSVLDDTDTLMDLAKDYQKNLVYGNVPEEDHGDAARTDFMQDRRERGEVWSGDGPGGEGELVFYDGDPPRGYLITPDGKGGKNYTNVTGFFSPPMGS